MCELLGLCFDRPVTAKFSFKEFRKRADKNPHGWGLAWFENGCTRVWKDENRADLSQKAESYIAQPTRSNIFISHVRRKSSGNVSLQNTHPFESTCTGHTIILAHNGTVSKPHLQRYIRQGYTPKGETDSELVLEALVHTIESRNASLDDFSVVRDILLELNNGPMNLLFSDGTKLFAYRSKCGRRELHFTERYKRPNDERLVDDEVDVEIYAEKEIGERGYVVATTPLTKTEKWQSFEPGELRIFKDGALFERLSCD